MVIKRDTSIEIGEHFIDVRGVVRKKSKSLYNMIPGFVFNYLKKIIHEDEVNRTIYDNRNKWGLEFVHAMIERFKLNINTQGLENIPRTGRCLIASNHPLGGIDGVALMSVVGRVRSDILFPVNDLLMNIPNMKELFIPINKHGSNAENIRIINETFESDFMILYFPAGLVSRKLKGVIKDLAWKKTFLTKAKKAGRDIIPVHINGRNSNFFYNLANWRKRFGLKANIEMLYLVDEMYKQKDKGINIKFGNPIPYQFFDKRHKDEPWAALLKEYVYLMDEGQQDSFEEWYEKNHKN